MAEPSRTTWPDWVVRPVLCSECGRRVTLSQAHRTAYPARKVWHRDCDPFTVRVVVERRVAA